MSVVLLLLRSGAGARRPLPRALLSSVPASACIALSAQRHSSTQSGRGGAGTGKRAAGAAEPPVLSRDRARSIMDRIRGSIKPSAPASSGDSAAEAQSAQQQPQNDPYSSSSTNAHKTATRSRDAFGHGDAHSTAGIRSVQNEVCISQKYCLFLFALSIDV
jgi:hypothetical protein